MKIQITNGNGWYKGFVGQEFEVHEISDVGAYFLQKWDMSSILLKKASRNALYSNLIVK